MHRFKLDYRVPPADLRAIVTLFYHFQGDIAEFADVERAQNAQLRARLSPGAGRYLFADGSVGDSHGFHLLGPTSQAVRVEATGPLLVVGVGLTAEGWAALTGVDASSMADRVIDATALFGDGLIEVEHALRAADDIDARLAIMEALLRRLVADHAASAEHFVQVIEAWLSSAPSPAIEALVAETGLSRRQVERRCKALYGAPPKLLARKCRALRAAVALASGATTVDDLIAEGFYDQSHLIREVKRFTGTTPGQIRHQPSLLAQLTIRHRRALGDQIPAIVSET